MAWQLRGFGDCFDDWAAGKSDQERIRLLLGLLELADRPLTELPGLRELGRSPMHRWAVVDSTFVFLQVYESQGCFYVDDLQDF